MNPRRFATVAAAITVVLVGWVVVWLAGFGSPGIESTGATPIVDRSPPSLAADAEFVNVPHVSKMGNGGIDRVDSTTPAEPVTAADTTVVPDQPESFAGAASTDSPPIQQSETPPVQVATTNPTDVVPDDAGKAVGAIDIPDECPAADGACIDRYLWALYQRTPKEDSIKVQERRKVTVKRKRRTVTVTRNFTKLVDEDFTWKDPKAAERAGMPMMDYVIGGMDRSFKLKLYHALRAADEAGLSPGITSAFRDNYRQSLASGLKASTDRSYHGGSFRGGYGHGLAADVVSVEGATRDQRWTSSDKLWKWIDAHGKEFGIARPYLDRDPPHVAPVDGQEYAAHHRGSKSQHARSDVKKHGPVAGCAGRSQPCKTPKDRKIVEGENDRTESVSPPPPGRPST